MSYQKGDGLITIAGKNYGLRLTIGALAELNTRLSLSGPTALATRFRQVSVEEARVLLACVMRPYFREEEAPPPAATFTDIDIANALPEICRLFEEAFREPAS